MNLLRFSKMHGAGNDFIVMAEGFSSNLDIMNSPLLKYIPNLCDRRRGVGADGVILISPSKNISCPENKMNPPSFRMKFFNNDGKSAEMCGNGLRCASLFATNHLTDRSGPILFETDSGILQTEVLKDGKIKIQIPLIEQANKLVIDDLECFTVNTGVPHLIIPVPDISAVDVVKQGSMLRYHHLFDPVGVNVDFISIQEDSGLPVLIRTYERGVEDETPACGTGVAAAATALALFYSMPSPINFMTPDKDVITIDFSIKDNMVREIQEISLTGPSEEVFRGELNESFLTQ